MRKHNVWMYHIIIIVFIFLMMPSLSVSATPPSAAPGITFVIQSSQCTETGFNDGNFDLLVKREDVAGKILSSESLLYQTLYGDIDSIEYLENDPLWISYLAYVENANVSYDGTCYISFAEGEDEFYMFDEVKLVYFDDLGNTLYISDSLEIVHPNSNQARFGEMVFHADEPYQIENNYTISSNMMWIAVLILGLQSLKWVFYALVIIGGAFVLYAWIRCIVIQVNRRKLR